MTPNVTVVGVNRAYDIRRLGWLVEFTGVLLPWGWPVEIFYLVVTKAGAYTITLPPLVRYSFPYTKTSKGQVHWKWAKDTLKFAEGWRTTNGHQLEMAF
ncbi:MAG: hypothetical protein A4E20_01330 [Nitrospira sp. SG-bin2]|uniref:hypothetical protein n=1 Tax=Nitrospira cf. moscoviensis SBR1015 TaxID=96242 RepID=UPI000A0DE759|nr:hypothetical protein [Nitrospira cf. moscoviensis SBR1015]OQW34846.1 MAG: hypothetical protein A4E20_01330 [Nitrospira sp. SG-bin2]